MERHAVYNFATMEKEPEVKMINRSEIRESFESKASSKDDERPDIAGGMPG